MSPPASPDRTSSGDDTLEVLLAVANEAALIINEVYSAPFSVDYKAPRDPVTVADRRANELICRRLGEAFPGVPVVAEESEPESFEGFRDATRVFFVDPLDGTREFVDRNGEFVVMIGLVDGERATHGVVHAPARGVAYIAELGRGAFRVESDGTRTPIRTSDVKELSRSSIVASRSHRDADVERALEILGVARVLALGSAGLKGAEVAQGGAEAYVAPFYGGKRWDACAVDVLVSAAGGRFTDGYGEPIDYRGASLANDRGLIATNGLIHDALLARLAAHRPSTS